MTYISGLSTGLNHMHARFHFDRGIYPDSGFHPDSGLSQGGTDICDRIWENRPNRRFGQN